MLLSVKILKISETASSIGLLRLHIWSVEFYAGKCTLHICFACLHACAAIIACLKLDFAAYAAVKEHISQMLTAKNATEANHTARKTGLPVISSKYAQSSQFSCDVIQARPTIQSLSTCSRTHWYLCQAAVGICGAACVNAVLTLQEAAVVTFQYLHGVLTQLLGKALPGEDAPYLQPRQRQWHQAEIPHKVLCSDNLHSTHHYAGDKCWCLHVLVCGSLSWAFEQR